MTTLLTQVEACLNSRLLQPLTDDPDDLMALTSGHFLIGASLLAVPEASMRDKKDNALSQWLLQKMRDHFWKWWLREYLQTLVCRPKWQRNKTGPNVGDLCLLRSESTPPTRWPLARVMVLHQRRRRNSCDHSAHSILGARPATCEDHPHVKSRHSSIFTALGFVSLINSEFS